MRISVALMLFISVAISGSSAKTFRKCELANLLENVYGMSRSDVKNFVCIAEFESSFRTTATNSNRNRSKDYGLFQINNKFWCTDGFARHNYCNVSCSELLKDDIGPAVRCAKVIKRRQGFTAWVAYKTKCSKKDLNEYMAECWN